MKYLIMIITLHSVSLSYAGVRVGNGGDAIVCYTDSSLKTRLSIDMFDYWEQSQVSHHGPLSLGKSNLTVKEKIAIATQRISRFDPLLSNEINMIAFTIADHIQDFLVTQSEIPEINDANPKIIPHNTNCLLTQFAIQWQNTENGIRRFYISEDLFNDPLTSADTQAGLILHEAFYRHAILNGATNSDGVRFFNYVTATNFYSTAQLDQYVDILNKSRMNDRGCSRLNEPFTQDLYIGTNNRSCFQGVVNLKSNLKLSYLDNQFSYEPSTQTLRLSNKNIELAIAHSGVFTPLQNKIEQFELRKNLLTLGFNKPSDPTAAINILDFKFNNKILNQINCTNKMTFDLELNSVVECEIQPHFIQLPNGNSFIAWRRIIYDGLSIIFNLQQPAYIEMSVPSRTKILVDPSYPAVFNQNGALIRAISLNEITYTQNGLTGHTNEFEIVNDQLQFNLVEKMNPLYLGLRIITTKSSKETMKICELKSNDFDYSTNTTKREYISTPEKVYDLDQEKIIYISDTYADVFERITCFGAFWVNVNLL